MVDNNNKNISTQCLTCLPTYLPGAVCGMIKASSEKNLVDKAE